jgi:hypothetical protein
MKSKNKAEATKPSLSKEAQDLINLSFKLMDYKISITPADGTISRDDLIARNKIIRESYEAAEIRVLDHTKEFFKALSHYGKPEDQVQLLKTFADSVYLDILLTRFVPAFDRNKITDYSVRELAQSILFNYLATLNIDPFLLLSNSAALVSLEPKILKKMIEENRFCIEKYHSIISVELKIIHMMIYNEAEYIRLLDSQNIVLNPALSFAILSDNENIVNHIFVKYIQYYKLVMNDINSYEELYKNFIDNSIKAIIRGNLNICLKFIHPVIWDLYQYSEKINILKLIISRAGSITSLALMRSLSDSNLLNAELFLRSISSSDDDFEKSLIFKAFEPFLKDMLMNALKSESISTAGDILRVIILMADSENTIALMNRLRSQKLLTIKLYQEVIAADFEGKYISEITKAFEVLQSSILLESLDSSKKFTELMKVYECFSKQEKINFFNKYYAKINSFIAKNKIKKIAISSSFFDDLKQEEIKRAKPKQKIEEPKQEAAKSVIIKQENTALAANEEVYGEWQEVSKAKIPAKKKEVQKHPVKFVASTPKPISQAIPDGVLNIEAIDGSSKEIQAIAETTFKPDEDGDKGAGAIIASTSAVIEVTKEAEIIAPTFAAKATAEDETNIGSITISNNSNKHRYKKPYSQKYLYSQPQQQNYYMPQPLPIITSYCAMSPTGPVNVVNAQDPVSGFVCTRYYDQFGREVFPIMNTLFSWNQGQQMPANQASLYYSASAGMNQYNNNQEQQIDNNHINLAAKEVEEFNISLSTFIAYDHGIEVILSEEQENYDYAKEEIEKREENAQAQVHFDSVEPEVFTSYVDSFVPIALCAASIGGFLFSSSSIDFTSEAMRDVTEFTTGLIFAGI